MLYKANIRSVNETKGTELLGAEELQSLKSMPKYLFIKCNLILRTGKTMKGGKQVCIL